MKRLAPAAVLAACALANSGTAWAAPVTASLPVNGPYLLSYNFETTCGTQGGLALGSFTATRPPANPDGSYDIRVKLTATFVTLAGPSLNACNPSSGKNSGRTVREGVSGSFVSTTVLHVTSATYTGTTSCPRNDVGSCDPFAYVRSAYGTSAVATPTSIHAVLHSNAPRLIRRQAMESCTGALCATGPLTVTGDIASGGG